MKKLIKIILVAFSIMSCTKDKSSAYDVEEVFPSSEEMLAQFQKALDAGSSHWEAILNPNAGKTYNLYFQLAKDGKVSSLADLTVKSAKDTKAATYRLEGKATHASLIFSAGTYLDDILHKEGFRNVGADTSYAFESMKGDTLILRGNRFGDELKLISLKAEDVSKYETGMLSNTFGYLSEFFESRRFFYFIAEGNIPVQFIIDPETRSIRVLYVENKQLKFSTTDYAYGIEKIRLKTPLRIGSQIISDLNFDTQKKTFYLQKNQASRYDLLGASLPVIPLHIMLGEEVSPILSMPSPIFIEELPGWSTSFRDVWMEATNKLFSERSFYLLVMAFELNTKANILDLKLYFQRGSSIFLGTFPFSFEKTDAGVYTLKRLPFEAGSIPHANAEFIEPSVAGLIGLFPDKQYTIDYYDAGDNVIGQFKSVDQAELYFTGEFGSYFE
ncbi:DUF4302 domain-containing protein [Sphingobacterium sp. UBA6645]|uniref:DUF4302 domain-containing protein n=1 Tax=Sphingobacterium sp. UBA6645 TaxID=1947511 RepID=UPI0025D706AD|nr:DUF4302 domain-containing protein [Sphingobacterium sp. UBA6645]